MPRLLIVSLVLLISSISINAIDFNLFPALFDINSSLLSKKCKNELINGEKLCSQANIAKWTKNGVIPDIEAAEKDELIYLKEFHFDKYHCCGAWDLSECISRFVKLKCSKRDYQLMLDMIDSLENQLSVNMCSDFSRASDNCRNKTRTLVFDIKLAKYFNKLPEIYPECRKLIELQDKTCNENAQDNWVLSTMFVELAGLDPDQIEDDEYQSMYEHLYCCIIWDALDCMVATIEGECDIDQDAIDETVDRIETLYNSLSCDLYPRHSIHCQRSEFEFKKDTKLNAALKKINKKQTE